MKRLLKYCLILVSLLILLGMVVPLGLFAYKYSQIGNMYSGNDQIVEYTKLNNVSENSLMAGSIASIVVFNVVACVVLFLQQFFWFKLNKKEQYPVPVKLTKKYSIVGYLYAVLIIINICWASVAYSTPLGIEPSKNACYTRIWIYGAGLIVISIFSLSIMGFAEYINLQILYNQNVQMVDEGIANGTYDPETRMPYETVDSSNELDNNDNYEDIIVPEINDLNESIMISDNEISKE